MEGDEVSNRSGTSRALARKRDGYGKAWGNVLLPDRRTVSGLFESAITRAFQDAGYRVMEKNDPSAADALRIEADVEQFWGWATPGLTAGHLECQVRVLINAPIASFDSGAYVAGYYRQPVYDLSDENWYRIINTCLNGFMDDLRGKLSYQEH
jgi:hypothetical protein